MKERGVITYNSRDGIRCKWLFNNHGCCRVGICGADQVETMQRLNEIVLISYKQHQIVDAGINGMESS